MSNESVHPTSGFTRSEEWANTVTHGLGLLLGIAGLAVIVTFAAIRGDAWLITAVSVYGATLVLLFGASTLYHSWRRLEGKRRLLVLDYCAIYLLIAGTYTPFALGPLRGPWGWTMLGVVWALALAGVARQLWVRRPRPGTSLVLYLAMGWLFLIAVKPLYERLPDGSFTLLVAGCLTYSAGVGFYAWRQLRFHHALWHLFVLGGSVCIYFSVLGFAS